MVYITAYVLVKHSHNPYFNRWFSAIMYEDDFELKQGMSQSLF